MIIKKGSKGFDVKLVQEYLTTLGYDTNGVDGIFGKGTYEAVISFQIDQGLHDDGIVGNDTFRKLVSEYYCAPFFSPQEVSTTPWMDEVFEDYFVSEIKGEDHNPKVLQMWKDAKLGGIKDDETAWCAGAVSAWLERSGIKSQRTAWARNYLNQGEELPLPKFGAIVVFERGNGGHVGFVTGVTLDGSQVKCIGGNQSNTVNERMFPVSRVLGYRNPNPEVQLPDAPICDTGNVSTTEA